MEVDDDGDARASWHDRTVQEEEVRVRLLARSPSGLAVLHAGLAVIFPVAYTGETESCAAPELPHGLGSPSFLWLGKRPAFILSLPHVRRGGEQEPCCGKHREHHHEQPQRADAHRRSASSGGRLICRTAYRSLRGRRQVGPRRRLLHMVVVHLADNVLELELIWRNRQAGCQELPTLRQGLHHSRI